MSHTWTKRLLILFGGIYTDIIPLRHYASAGKWRRLFFAGDDDEASTFRQKQQKAFDCTQSWIRSQSTRTNNKRLRSGYCTVETADRHEASRSLSATAELLVAHCCKHLNVVTKHCKNVTNAPPIHYHYSVCARYKCTHNNNTGQARHYLVTARCCI